MTNTEIPYVIPFVLGPTPAEVTASITAGPTADAGVGTTFDTDTLATTVTLVAEATIAAVADADTVAVTAGQTAESTAQLFSESIILDATATPTASPIKGQIINASLGIVAPELEMGFPYSFPIIFGTQTAPLLTKVMVGETSLAITAATSSELTRDQTLNANLDVTATTTNTVTFDAQLDTNMAVTVTLSAEVSRTATTNTLLELSSSPFSEISLGQDLDASVAATVTASASSYTDLVAAANLDVTVGFSVDGVRNAVVDAELQVTASPSGVANFDAFFGADELAVVMATSPEVIRNAGTDAELTLDVIADAETYWSTQADAELATTATVEAFQTSGAQSDIFGGQIEVTFTAEATRHVYADVDEIAVTAELSGLVLRNHNADTDLAVEVTFDATRSFEAVADAELAITATFTEPEPVKGLIGEANLDVTVTPTTGDMTWTQQLDAELAITVDSSGTLSQGFPADAELAVIAGTPAWDNFTAYAPGDVVSLDGSLWILDHYAGWTIGGPPPGYGWALLAADVTGASIIRNQFADTQELAVTGTVESGILFSALLDTELETTCSRGGEITRNHNVDAALDLTVDLTGAVEATFLIDADLSGTVSAEVEIQRDVFCDADFAADAGTFVLIYNLGRVESFLATDASTSGEATRNTFSESELASTATTDAEAIRNQFCDAELAVTADLTTEGTRNQFADALLEASTGSIGAVYWDAGAEVDLSITAESSIDFIKGMNLDSLLALLAPTEERLRSDALLDIDLVLSSGSTPFAYRGFFVDAPVPITVSITELATQLDAVAGALLTIPVTTTTEMSELLGSNFFLFHL